jgi:Fic family protein
VALQEPLLYLSLYSKTNRDRYYDLLQRVRTQGAWEEWLAFFLEGTEITARAAAEAAKQILTLFAKDGARIQTLGRAVPSALRVHEYMQKKPLASIGALADKLNLSIPTVTVALDHLVRLGIVKEVTGKRRARVFGYSRYLKILSEGTQPIQQ